MLAREIPAVVPFLSLFEICPIGQVWCLIVSIPDLCTLTYFQSYAYFYEISY